MNPAVPSSLVLVTERESGFFCDLEDMLARLVPVELAARERLIVMLLGGLGNVPGAMVAGLMLGMIEILSAAYIGTTERDLFSFLILILILLFRPTGLFGTRTAEQR